MQFLAFTLQNDGIMSQCRQFNSRLPGVNYPPARQRAGTHPSVKYALHSWFVPSDVAMSTHESSQTAVGGAGKRILQHGTMDGWKVLDDADATQKNDGDTVCPSGEDTFIWAPIPEIMVSDISLKPCYELAGLLTHLLGQMPSYNAWQRIETLR